PPGSARTRPRLLERARRQRHLTDGRAPRAPRPGGAGGRAGALSFDRAAQARRARPPARPAGASVVARRTAQRPRHGRDRTGGDADRRASRGGRNLRRRLPPADPARGGHAARDRGFRRVIGRLLLRDCMLLMPGGRRGGALLPLLFFLAVAMIYPFAVGPDAPLLARTGGGVIWVAALLAAILPLDRLVAPDLEEGVFDQLAVRGVAEELAVAVRMLAHWLSFAPLLLLATLLAAALFGLEQETVRTVLLG